MVKLIEGGKMDYAKFGDLETYVFKDVNCKFKKNGFLNAFDFFCIIIWKANRAKTKTSDRLCKIANTTNLDDICKTITCEIYQEKDDKNKIRLLLQKWRFNLPMASAILAVLYPNRFPIYDIRVCSILNEFYDLNGKGIKRKVEGYFRFRDKIKKISKSRKKSLREVDKLLWGESFYKDLKQDVKDNFQRLKKTK
jgi:hypothetical protein